VIKTKKVQLMETKQKKEKIFNNKSGKFLRRLVGVFKEEVDYV
jgi:hypothetical protein